MFPKPECCNIYPKMVGLIIYVDDSPLMLQRYTTPLEIVPIRRLEAMIYIVSVFLTGSFHVYTNRRPRIPLYYTL